MAGLRALYPGAQISWLVEARSADAVASQSTLDEVLVFPREHLAGLLRGRRAGALLAGVARFTTELRQRRFDLVLDFHAILKSGVLARLSGAPQRVSFGRSFAREQSWLFANLRADLGAERISRFSRNAALVEYLGGEVQKPRAGLIRATPEAQRRLRKALGTGVAPVVIHPGTSAGTPYKRYTVAGHAAVARALAEQLGIACLVSYGPGDAERRFAQAVVDEAEGAAALAPATSDFDELAALLTQARLFIGSDSGPLHLASLVGTPVVQLLGPTDPIENEPYPGAPWRRVYQPIACSPCRRGCAAASCMQRIPPSAVVAAARELLAAGESGVVAASGPAQAQSRISPA